MVAAGDEENAEAGSQGEGEQDPRVYTVRISRATGIDWGTDLSFKWVYVRALEPSGSGLQAGIAVGDQVLSRTSPEDAPSLNFQTDAYSIP